MNRLLAADHKPTETEVVVHYAVQPLRKDSFHECLHKIVDRFQYNQQGVGSDIKIFELNQATFECKMAFPGNLFEEENLPQNLSVIAGNIFENPDETSVRILEIFWPKKIMKTFQGPSKGIRNIRGEANIHDRPLLSGLLLPKYLLNTKEYLEKAYLMWMGGCDIVEENEVMSAQSTHGFQERIEFLSKEMKSCSERTKKEKIYIPNITAGTTEEMYRRAKLVKSLGIHFVSVNAIQIGFGALNSLIRVCRELHLGISGHQNGCGLWTRNPQFGWTLRTLTTLQKHLGLDMVHLEPHDPDTKDTISSLTKSEGSIYPAFPIYGGNIHPGDIENIIKSHGHDLVIRGEQWMESHPDGLKNGAEAFLFAIESAAQGLEASSAMKKNDSFRKSLESWSQMKTNS